MTATRHNFKHYSGSGADIPSTWIGVCRCGIYQRFQSVETVRVGVRTATFRRKDVPVYSADLKSWSFDKPACVGNASK